MKAHQNLQQNQRKRIAEKMSLKQFEEQQNEDGEHAITEEREDFMIPPSSDDGIPTFRVAHFLKPLLNPKTQPLPKPPFHSLSSSPKITSEVPRRVLFRCILKPQTSWKSWVDDLEKTHQSIWKKVGIFDAIRASTYNIKRDYQLIKCLAENWCPETNTFVFSWGECTVTLEDVMILGGFSVMGDSVFTVTQSKRFEEIKGLLAKSCTEINRNNSNNLSHNGWLNHYKGVGGEIEHVALIVLWLSRCVFCTNYYSRINPSVFGIAINLALGKKYALAPAILASIYGELTLLKQKGVADSSELILSAPLHLVQIWAWERFRVSSPKPNCLNEGEPRMARWHNVSKLKTLSLGLDVGFDAESFMWRPYALCLENWKIPKFYCDEGMWVVVNSEVDEELLSYVRCLRASELVGFDCVTQYLPHRVGLQFGMDQDIPNFVPRSNSYFKLAWSTYDKPLGGLKLYLPPRLFDGDVTVQYARWWRPVLALDNDTFMEPLATCTELNERNDIQEMDVHVAECGKDMLEDKSSFAKGMKPEYAESKSTGITDLDELDNSLIGPEDKDFDEQSELKVGENKQVSEGGKNSEGASSFDERLSTVNGILIGEGPSIKAENNAMVADNVEDAQHNTGGIDADKKQTATSGDDPACNPFEELFADFETRMNQLEKKLSDNFKAAKSKAMVG